MPSREATAELGQRFSRPFGNSSVMRPTPTFKRWAIIESPSGTELPRTGKVSVKDKLVRFTRPGVTEEYSVSVDGVRQDFIIESPPLAPPPSPLDPRPSTLNHSAGDLRVELALSGARAEATASGSRLTLEGSGRALAYSRLRVVDATGRELTARLEVLSPDRLAVSVADTNAVYPVRIDPTFSDADWVSLNPGLPGASGTVDAIAIDGTGNVYVGGDFSVIGGVLANHVAKWDGNVWSALDSGIDGTVHALAASGTNLYAGGRFFTAGGVPANCIAKWDGRAWSALGSGMGDFLYGVESLAVSGANLYAGGDFNTAGGVSAYQIAKWNGSAWSALGSGSRGGDVRALAVSGTTLYAAGAFTGQPVYISKWDGSAWSAVGPGTGQVSPGPVLALAVSGTTLYAGGLDFIGKWDGSAWSAFGSGVGVGSGEYAAVYALAADGAGNVFVAGYFDTAGGLPANHIAKWDGNAWSALGSGMNDGAAVYALAVGGTNLYAGGDFTIVGGLPANDIAKWNGSGWSALSSGTVGIGNSVSAVAVSGTNLYVGGSFTSAGGLPANYIAKTDGIAWSALGSGMGNGDYPPTIFALAVSGGDLYVGGNFTTAGGAPANCIAQWDGGAWSALGSGMDGQVQALAVSGANLYAGGNFNTAGGVSAYKIAKWNGSAWSALGSGMNGIVYGLAVSGTNLYAAGSFGTAGGIPANNIAKWDGSAWSALGSGINGTVYALAVSGTSLYAGGQFGTAGGVTAYGTARWDGNAWWPLGSGMSGTVYALAVDGTGLYAGGSFTPPYGAPGNYIAKWDGSVWSALGSGMDSTVNALLADGVGHLFVGGNFTLAGTNVSPYIAQANLGGVPTNLPPVIMASPASLTVASGTTAEFQVEAIGSPPLVYQWVFNGTNAIAGATTAALSLTNVQLTQAGTYSVAVSNPYGAVTSAPALLQVSPRGIVVTNSETALRAVMAPGGTVTFACDGTITLASTLNITNDTTLDGGGRQVTISGNSAVRVFSIATNVHLTVVNLTIADGTSLGGSAILNLGGTANLNGVTFRSNTAIINYSSDALSPKGGGAIFNRGGTVNATNCSFARNAAYIPDGSVTGGDLVCGGAIRNEAGLLALRSCTLVGNQALVYQDTRAHTVRGGAIHNSGTATLDLCTLAGNSATGGASGVVIGGPGLSGGEGSGGAIYNEGTLTTDRTTLRGNTATGGDGSPGCWSIWSGYIGDAFAGGPGANGLGAAICNLGSLSVSGSTLASNVVTGGSGGSGGYGEFSGYADSPNGASGGNGGSGLGGALHNSGAASLVNCTIAYNTGNGRPGGSGGASQMPSYPRYHQGAGGNGGGGGSGFGGVDGTCNLVNCTLASNQGIAGLGGGGGGGNPSGGPGVSGTAWGGTTCSALVNTLIASNTPAGGDTFPDPKLGPLADNGGPTLTMALLPGSPAIDAGNTSLAPATDQRGFPRPAGQAADLGAFEYGSVMLGPPQVSTLPATGVSTNSATLNGTVNPVGWSTTAWFQWGATTNYGNLTSVTALGSEAAALPLFAPLDGLTPMVTYHFRVAATNNYGLAYGSDQSFTTLVLPEVSTLPARSISTNSATLNGTVNPNGWPATAWFEWGATTNYGNLTSVTALGSGATALPLSASLAGLTLYVTYHFRVVATNDYGLVCGSDQSFTVRSGAVLPFDTNWFSLGLGMNGIVNALAVRGTNLYAGGYFAAAGGVPANNIAKWDGSAWSALGSGLNGMVSALAVSGTNLYAGGEFTTAGGVSANFIAKWDGSAWSALGSGISASYPSEVLALAVSGTNLYVGGRFTVAGGAPGNYIAKWDGSTWSALGSGMNNQVNALAVVGTNLYAGGAFTYAGGVFANCIAKWDGNAWSALVPGTWTQGPPGSILALAVSGTDLYAGGAWTVFYDSGASGEYVNGHIAKWNGSAWSSLWSLSPAGTPWVNALAVSGTNLYAGGYFTTADGAPGSYIAKWDGSTWSALGSGTDQYVTALAADGLGRLFVGGAFSLAGNNESPYVAEAILGGAPTPEVSNPLILTSGPRFGVQSNAFGFIISWATNLPVVVEACTNLANHSWSPVQTNALAGGWSYFSDPQWTNYPGRFYRVRSP
jgi:hypothetical protein